MVRSFRSGFALTLGGLAAFLGVGCGSSHNGEVPVNHEPDIEECATVQGSYKLGEDFDVQFLCKASDVDGDAVSCTVNFNGRQYNDGDQVSIDEFDEGENSFQCLAKETSTQERLERLANGSVTVEPAEENHAPDDIDTSSVTISYDGQTFNFGDSLPAWKSGMGPVVVGFTVPLDEDGDSLIGKLKINDQVLYDQHVTPGEHHEFEFDPETDCGGECSADDYNLELEIDDGNGGVVDLDLGDVVVEAGSVNHTPELERYVLNSVYTGKNLSIHFDPYDPEDDLMNYSIESVQPSDLVEVRVRGPPDYDGSIVAPNIPESAVGPARIVLKICDDKDACSVNNIDFVIDRFESYLSFVDEQDNWYTVRGSNSFVQDVMKDVGVFRLEDDQGIGYETNISKPAELNAALQAYTEVADEAENYNIQYDQTRSALLEKIQNQEIKILQARVIDHQ